MAKKQAPADPLKAKEARQKKIAAVGAVLLVGVLAIQVPKLMKQMGHSSAPPPPAATAALPSTTPVGATPTTPAAGTDSGLLSASAPTASIGQLSSFGSFVSKDPFASQLPTPSTSGKTPTGGAPTPPTNPPTPPTPPSGGGTGTPSTPAVPTSAVISVNGVKEQVSVGGDFPSRAPFFHLVSLSQHSARISIAGGSLASGAPTLTIYERKPVTLMNTTDGTRYTIVLEPQGTQAPTATTTRATTTTAAATTTGTTTSGG